MAGELSGDKAFQDVLKGRTPGFGPGVFCCLGWPPGPRWAVGRMDEPGTAHVCVYPLHSARESAQRIGTLGFGRVLCAEHVDSVSYHFGNFCFSRLRSHSNLPADLKGCAGTALRRKKTIQP